MITVEILVAIGVACIATALLAILTDKGDDEYDRSYCSGGGPYEVPAEEPWFMNRPEQGIVNWRKRECDNLPAVRADGEVGESLLEFVRRQRVFDEGV